MYLKRYVIDGPDHMIDQLIFAVRANRGMLPAGTVQDPVLARDVEEAVARPLSLIVRALSHGPA
jgi:hypothetical protein